MGVMVADVVLPEVVEDGAGMRAIILGGGTGFTVNTACAVPPLAEAVKVTGVQLATTLVGIENTALTEPAGMVKVVDATTAVLELVSVTLTALAGVELSDTVADVALPPITVAGDRLRPLTGGGGTGFTV